MSAIETLDNFFSTHILKTEYFGYATPEREAAIRRAEIMVGTEAEPDGDPLAAVAEQTVHLLTHPDANDLAPRARRRLRDAKECFGHCRHDADCRECDFLASCACISDTEDRIEQHSGMISVETITGWALACSTDAYTPGNDEEEEPDENQVMPPDMKLLADFCHFIFHLDDYTLGILAEIINPDQEEFGKYTVAELARVHQCSRQAMHRKMLSSVRRYPQLASLFQIVLRKIGRARKQFRNPEPPAPQIAAQELTDAD